MTSKLSPSFCSIECVVACGLPLAAFGTDGWNLPLQIANTTIPYPYTFLQAALINIGVIYLVLLAMIGVTLLLSAKMKSPYAVLIILAPLLFIPMFLTPNGTTGHHGQGHIICCYFYCPTVRQCRNLANIFRINSAVWFLMYSP